MPFRDRWIHSQLPTLEPQFPRLKTTSRDSNSNLSRNCPHERKAHKSFSLPNIYPPTTSLPNEILTQIFELGPSQPWERLRHALCVSQVSGYWRDVACGTPSLWTSIRVADCQDQIEQVEMLICRSGSRPLDIEFESVCGTILSDQLALILPLAPRWRTLLVSAEYWRNVSKILAPCADLFVPILESFEVMMRCESDEEEEEEDMTDDHLLIFQGGAPRLTHVKIEGVPLTSCQPPLSSVSSLQLHYPAIQLERDLFRHILTGSKHLTTLHLYGDIFNVLSISNPINIPSLHSLTISQIVPYYALAALESPALECLDISSHTSIPSFGVVFRDNISRYSHLESLTFRNANCRVRAANSMIMFLPSIKRVFLKSCDSPDILLGHLIPRGGEVEERLPWPLLETIGLSRVDSKELAVLCVIVSDRISRGRPLACLYIKGGFPELPMDKLSWLQERVHVEDYQLPSH